VAHVQRPRVAGAQAGRLEQGALVRSSFIWSLATAVLSHSYFKTCTESRIYRVHQLISVTAGELERINVLLILDRVAKSWASPSKQKAFLQNDHRASRANLISNQTQAIVARYVLKSPDGRRWAISRPRKTRGGSTAITSERISLTLCIHQDTDGIGSSSASGRPSQSSTAISPKIRQSSRSR
jgi:hypothetical protein